MTNGTAAQQHSSTANGMEIPVSEVASQRCSVMLCATVLLLCRRWRKQLQKAWTQQTLNVDIVKLCTVLPHVTLPCSPPRFCLVWRKFDVLVPDSTYSWNSLTSGESPGFWYVLVQTSYWFVKSQCFSAVSIFSDMTQLCVAQRENNAPMSGGDIFTMGTAPLSACFSVLFAAWLFKIRQLGCELLNGTCKCASKSFFVLQRHSRRLLRRHWLTNQQLGS